MVKRKAVLLYVKIIAAGLQAEIIYGMIAELRSTAPCRSL
jgi:hypothetical protein